jgi:glyoxylase-like metal-dependent hydrolase (beta-lactamase superfamily II)
MLFDEWVATLEALKKLDFAVVLPGHGVPFSDKGRITAFQSYLTDLISQAAPAGRLRGGRRPARRPHRAPKGYSQIQGRGADLQGMRRV